MTEINAQVWLTSVIGQELSHAEAMELLLVSKRVDLKKGDRLFGEGDAAGEMYLIVNGQIDVVKSTADGKEHVIAELGNGSVIGEMSALLAETRSASGLCREDTRVLRIDWVDFEKLLAEHPHAAFKLLLGITRMIAGRLKRINSRFATLLGDTRASLPPEDTTAKSVEEFADFKRKVLSDWSF